MKILLALLVGVMVALISFSQASAAPNKSNNPNIVANYDSGEHGIPGESDTHTGMDVVMKAGNSGHFQQWFYGHSTENGGITEGEHSFWRNVGSKTECKDNEVLVLDAYPEWGDYLEPGANYCVKTNEYRVSD